jgi:predicted ATPase
VSDEVQDVRTRLVALDALLLDPNNPRLIEDPLWPRVPDEEIPKPRVQRETAERLLGDRGENIDDLLESIEDLGWLEAEPIRVRPLLNGRLVVLDGNRRIVALRRLDEELDRPNTTLDIRVTEAEPNQAKMDLEHGARHIVEREPWSDFCEAVWRREMPPLGISDDQELALRLCHEYRSSRWGEQFRSWTFSIICAALSYETIRNWLGHGAGPSPSPSNLQRFFSWISRDSESDGNVPNARPILQSTPDLDRLNDILQSPEPLHLIDIEGELRTAGRVRALRYRYGKLRSLEAVAAAQTTIVELRRMIESAGEEPVAPTSELPWPVVFTEGGVGLTSVRITRYRGLSNVSLEGLTRINLLVGVNNAGKTSVLEAIYLLCRRSDPRGLLDSIRARVRTDPEALPPATLVRVLPGSISIAGTLPGGTGVEVEHVVSDEPPNGSANLATFLASLRIEARGPREEQVSLTEFHTNRPRRTQILEGARAWLAPAVFHSPFSLADRKVLTACYERSVEEGTKAEIIGFIKQHVEEGVEDIELVNTDGRFIVQHRTDDPLDLSSYGEGMQRIFQIGLLFAAHARGVVLIDEFENALHTHVLTDFSRMVQDLAVRFDVQVFLTTHSDEALRAFLLNDYRTEDVSTFLLKKEEGRISVRRFDGKSHKRAIELADADVRRL